MTETHNQTTYFHEIPNFGKIGYSNEGKILYLFKGDAIMQEVWPVERNVYEALLTFFGIEHGPKVEEEEVIGLVVIGGVEYCWNEDLILSPTRSSVISAVGYDKKRDNLHIIFHNNPTKVWVYFDVPEYCGKDIFHAHSIGSFYNTYIKGRFNTETYEL